MPSGKARKARMKKRHKARQSDGALSPDTDKELERLVQASLRTRADKPKLEGVAPSTPDEFEFERGYFRTTQEILVKKAAVQGAQGRQRERNQRRDSKRQSERAQRLRNRDLFASLLRRTYAALRKQGLSDKVIGAEKAIDALGNFDTGKILRAAPGADGLYDSHADPKRAYYDHSMRKLYFHDGTETLALTFEQVSARLSRLKKSR
jgi:hypothetical protein